MKVSIFGLGYVGSVSAACLADRGHEVVGVDVSPTKVELINKGQSTVIEELIGELTQEVSEKGLLRATTDSAEAIANTELSLICVGTPSAPNGSLSTEYLERAAEQIGEAIGKKAERHTVVFRSTMLPGTCERLLVPILEKYSGKRAGVDFGVAVNPEYLRESTSVWDFRNPPKTVVGQSDDITGDVVLSLYEGLPGPVFRVPIAVAEMSKYVDNCFHGLKVAFGNEIGAIAHALGLDSWKVMDVFLSDTKLNISPAYLRPGFAFGGSCLPKDLRGLVYAARRADVDVPVLENVLESNEAHLKRSFELIAGTGKRKVGLFGLSFKPGTDDLRESPNVELAERLLGKGYDLRIYDANVTLSRLVGANREFIENRLKHLNVVLTDSVDEVLEHAEVCVIGTKDQAVLDILDKAGERPIVDLVRVPDAEQRRETENYLGLGW
jgi:GDP-mannose 6-dehydrogenase